MQISGADYGPAVPSGVFFVRLRRPRTRLTGNSPGPQPEAWVLILPVQIELNRRLHSVPIQA